MIDSTAIVPGMVSNETRPASLEGVELDFQSLWATIYNNLVIIIIVPLIAVVIGATITAFTPRQYQAIATVQIEQQTSKVLSNGDTSATAATADSERFLQTQLGLLNSKALAGQVVDSLGLAKSDDALERLGLPEKQLRGMANQTDRRAALVAVLRSALGVTLPRDSRIAQVTITCRDAELCAKITNAYVSEFIVYNLQQKYQESSYALRFLREQLQDSKNRLQDSERSAVAYARQQRLVDTGASPGADRDIASPTVANLIELNTALAAAQTATIESGQRWNEARSTPVLNQPEVLQSPSVQALIERRALAQVDYQRERQRHKPSYPTMEQAASQIASLDDEINKIGLATRSGLKNRYDVAQRNERQLSAKINDLKSRTLSERDTSIGYNILRREVDTNRTMYDGLLQRYKEVSAASGVTAKNISAVDQAEVPSNPITPKLRMNLLTAGILGLMLALLIVVLREKYFDAIRSPAELQRKLATPLLGVFPRATSKGGPIEALALPRSALSEAAVSIASALVSAMPNGLPGAIAITSSKAGEGKSSFAYGVARAMARSGRRVLLIDADLRRPSLHTLLGFENDKGLSTILSQQMLLAHAIQPTVIDSLSVVLSGPTPANPAELLAGPRLRALLTEAHHHADVMIVDSPPVLQLADALLIGAAVDVCVLLVDAQSANARPARTSLRRLRQGGVNVIGSVLSNFKVKTTDYVY